MIDNASYLRKWRANNPGKHQEYCKSYYTKNRDKVIARQAIRNKQLSYIVKSYKSTATKNNRSWELSDEQAFDLMLSDCFYCGAKPNPTNGIDRVNNEEGYTYSNVVSCCKWCNYSKRDLKVEDFIQKCGDVVNHFETKTMPCFLNIAKSRLQ